MTNLERIKEFDAVQMAELMMKCNSEENCEFCAYIHTEKCKNEDCCLPGIIEYLKSGDEYLKPCPFCGNLARLEESPVGFYILCGNSNCEAMISLQNTRQDAIEVWNRRTE